MVAATPETPANGGDGAPAASSASSLGGLAMIRRMSPYWDSHMTVPVLDWMVENEVRPGSLAAQGDVIGFTPSSNCRPSKPYLSYLNCASQDAFVDVCKRTPATKSDASREPCLLYLFLPCSWWCIGVTRVSGFCHNISQPVCVRSLTVFRLLW